MAILKRIYWLVAAAFAGLALFGAAGGAFAPRPVVAATPALANTQAVYAAFTLNLTRFITWPEGAFARPDEPFVIGTFPRDPVNDELDAAVRGENVAGHPVRTMRLQSLDDLAKCHVLFFSKNVAPRPAVLARVARKPILTVSDADGFLELGGHVRFVAQPPSTRLQISPDNLKASGLESRAQLLRLASSP